MQVPCLCGTRKSRRRVKSALRKQRYTVTPFDCNLLAHLIVPWPMQKFMCYCTVFALFYFEFEGNFQVQALGGLYLEGLFNGGFFALWVWRGLFSEFCGSPATIFIFTALLFMVESKCFSRLIFSNFQAFCFSDLIYTLRY